MVKNLFGQIDLTKLGIIVRNHPEMVKTVTLKDGSVHQFINININAKQQADAFGNVAFLKVGIKKADEKEGVSYFLGDLKESRVQPQAQVQAIPVGAKPVIDAPRYEGTGNESNANDLPF